MGRSAPTAALLLLLAAVTVPHAAGQLTDQRLMLPGRPASPEVSAAASGGGPYPEERYGYFSPKFAPTRRLFYWYYQARNATTGAALNSTSTPLIAWFNGGPGCSSLWGMFFENGPYTLNASLQLVPNRQTWANVGHMLYIDQPIGTGLSYSTKKGDTTRTQLDVAQTVLAFLQAFLKSPTYSYLSRNPLYLTGEPFAGHYLPTIGAYMKLTMPAMRLAGVAMGNPCTNGPAQYQSYPTYALANGLIDQPLYKRVTASVASCKLQAVVCGVLDPSTCSTATAFCEGRLWNDMLSGPRSQLGRKNPYNIKSTAKDCGSANVYNCYAALDARVEAYIDANKAKLGAPSFLTYRVCADAPYKSLHHDIVASYDDLVGALLDNGVPVMVYSGENDYVCNWMSSKQWLDGLVWGQQGSWARAAVQSWAGGTFKRVGPLSFVRVAKAGHMVPLDQPATSLLLLRRWITDGQPTAPAINRTSRIVVL